MATEAATTVEATTTAVVAATAATEAATTAEVATIAVVAATVCTL